MPTYQFDTQLIMRFGFGLGIIIILMIVAVWLLKKAGVTSNISKERSKQKRAQVVEAHMIDPKRRLVMIRRDNVEHLILLGPNNDLIIETNIPDHEEQFNKLIHASSKAPSVETKKEPQIQ